MDAPSVPRGGSNWENVKVQDKLHSILIVKSRYGIHNNIFEPQDMQHTCVNPMLHEIVNCNDKEAVVWVRGLEGVPNIHSVSVVSVNNGACAMWDMWLDDGISDCKGLIIEDWQQLFSWGEWDIGRPCFHLGTRMPSPAHALLT